MEELSEITFRSVLKRYLAVALSAATINLVGFVILYVLVRIASSPYPGPNMVLTFQAGMVVMLGGLAAGVTGITLRVAHKAVQGVVLNFGYNAVNGAVTGALVGITSAIAIQHMLNLVEELAFYFRRNEFDASSLVLITPLLGAITGAFTGAIRQYAAFSKPGFWAFNGAALLSAFCSAMGAAGGGFIAGVLMSLPEGFDLLTAGLFGGLAAVFGLMFGGVIAILLGYIANFTSTNENRVVCHVIAAACGATLGVGIATLILEALGSI